MDKSNFLESLIRLFAEHEIRYCVIGGQAVNAYGEPLISLDLDVAVAVDQIELVESLLRAAFTVERFPNSLNVSASGSDLRVQIQIDPRYFAFPERSAIRDVLGLPLPVARMDDVLQGKVWTALDPGRRPIKRGKDLLDIERLIEAHPELLPQIPAEIRERLA